MESECQVVDWYLAIMEDGKDTKKLVKDYAELKGKLTNEKL